MRDYSQDSRIVLTLDAGGTNFRFSAVRGGTRLVETVVMPACPDDLNECLRRVVDGFARVKQACPQPPAAISFAFPGPADYPAGIIGDLGNLPCFRNGVALGPMLEQEFGVPVFINNDGDLFALGEAMGGLLPHVNDLLEKAGSPKRFHNLLGITLGTGFGGGIVRNGELFLGDNSMAAEIWLLRNKLAPGMNAEEGASKRAVRAVYADLAGIAPEAAPEPDEIYNIALDKRKGDKMAAVEAFRRLGETAGDAIGNALTLVDGLVVIGGGLSGAAPLILPALVAELNGEYILHDGKRIHRLASRAFNLENPGELSVFLKGGAQEIKVPGNSASAGKVRTVKYDPLQRVGVGLSRLGTSEAVALGAYAFALRKLDGL